MDNCLAACIDRIKIKSDKISSPIYVFSKDTFQNTWRNLRNDIVEVEKQVLDGHLYEQRVDDLISTDMISVLATGFGNKEIISSGTNFPNI